MKKVLKKSVLNLTLLSFLFLYSSSLSAYEETDDLYFCEIDDNDCPSGTFSVTQYFKVKIKVCSNSVKATGLIFGETSGEWGFKDNGKGMLVLEKYNGLLGFKLYIEKANNKIWYKTCQRRGIDDRRYNCSKRKYAGRL